MTNLLSRRDIDFMLYDWLGIGTLFERAAHAEHNAETVTAVLDLAERIATDHAAVALKPSDRHEPWQDADGVHVAPEIATAVRAYLDAGLLAGPFAAEAGGLGLPHVVASAALAYVMAGSIAVAAFPMLAGANARLIATFGTQAQFDAFARPQIEGTALGTMCLSEPQAGSALGDIRTKAVADGPDELGRRFRIIGNKMWISGGDHDVTPDITHLVLAKVVDEHGALPTGTTGISLFIVPKRLGRAIPNDIVVAGLNHKMGYRGIPNCLLNFGEGTHQPGGRVGAIGYLVGETGDGLRQMFQMMNEARIQVGLGAAALGYRGFLLSVDYARDRRQGRRPGTPPEAPAVPITDHPDVRRMLLTQKCYAEGSLALVLYCARLLDDLHGTPPAEAAAARRLLDLLTPVAKTWASDMGLAANDIAIQIHGGYGYTRDFDVEQLYRDNRLNPIHEGTTGIQAQDLLGRKILRDRGGALAELQVRIAATSARASQDARFRPLAFELDAVWDRIATTVQRVGAMPEGRQLDNATPFLRAFGHAVAAWLWLDQVAACAGDTPFARGKLAAARFFFEHEVPLIDAWLTPVERGSELLATLDTAIF